MRRAFTEDGWKDYLYWLEHDRATLRRINALIQESARTPFKGIGKPEPLVGNWKGWWSRRIDGTNRLIYRIHEGQLEIAQCRTHYRER